MKVALILIFFLAESPIFANGLLESITKLVFSGIQVGLQGLFKEDQNDLQNIENYLQELIMKFDNLSKDIKNSFEGLKDHISVENRESKIQDLQNKIEAKFTSTKEYMAHVQNLENTTLQKMMENLSDGEGSIDNLVHLFHLKIFGRDSVYLNKIIEVIRRNQSHFSTNTGMSEEFVLNRSFLAMNSVECKALILQKVNCYLKYRLGLGNFTTEMAIYEKSFETRFKHSLQRMNNYFLTSNRYLYKLDGESHERGRTFAEVTRFNQIYFLQEANFGSCTGICEDYKSPRYHTSESYPYRQRQCKGTLSNCEGLTQGVLRFHFASIPDDNDDRRYQHVWHEVLSFKKCMTTIYGNRTSHNSGISLELDKWTRGFVYCDTCQCQCDDPYDEKSFRSFSLTPLYSDTDKNMVITGIQLAVKGKAFVFKITQAPLNPLGQVNGSVSVKMNEPSPNDRFFKLRHDKRSFYMGKAELDITKTLDYVVTGVSFVEKNGNLALEVRFTKFNYTSGQLYDANKRENTKIVSNALSRNLIKQESWGKCPDAYHDNKPSETKSGLIQFDITSLKENVGQRTVPFLDLQEVKSTEMALSGIGLQFRSRKESGGFISPILVTYPSFYGFQGATLLQ